ncbi:hypothetical protein SAMN04488168_110144 [Bacillus sp. 491mf]|nr:hypothetical protein SAMN04488168_110144 [Bacillus sp. 491mf]
MESQFYEVIRFYEEKISNFQLFSKRHWWITCYGGFLVSFFILVFLAPNNMIGHLLSVILVFSLVAILKIGRRH